jgi:hypothetical protein
MNPHLIVTLVILVTEMAPFLSGRFSPNRAVMLALPVFRAADSKMNSL